MKKALLAAVALLVLAGCGGQTPPSETADGKKVVASMEAEIANPGQGVEKADATCIAKRFVDDLGIKRLSDTGVVSKDLSYNAAATDPTKANAKVLTGFTKARNYCLKSKVAASMAKVIATQGSLVDKSHAKCVATTFTHRVGLAQLIGGQVITTTLAYVENGAVQQPAVAAGYAKALTSCLGAKKVDAALRKAVESAYETSQSGGPVLGDPKCFVAAFAKDVGSAGLLGTRLVSDTGAFNNQGAEYDEKTATALAGAILGCVDVLKTEAASAVAENKKLDAAKVEACLKSKISDLYLRDNFLVNRLMNRVKLANTANAVIQARVSSCERA